MPVSRKTKDEQELDTDWRRLVQAYITDEKAYTYELARHHFKRWPGNRGAHFVLAECLISFRRYDEAKTLLLKAMPRSRPSARRWLEQSMATLYDEKGDYHSAERWYRRAISSKRSAVPELYVFLGSVLAKQGRPAEAKSAHRRAITLWRKAGRPKDADEPFYNLALLYRAEGKYKRALHYVEQAIKLDPKYTIAKKLRRDLVKTLKFLHNKQPRPKRQN